MTASKIMVIGSGGAGKSRLAGRLGEVSGLPVVHLDTLYWKPGWVPTPDDEWDEVMRGLVAQPEWILDGNYGRTMEMRFEAADTIVLVDTPRWRCLWRAVTRRIKHIGRSRPDMGAGCPEKLDLAFLRWIWGYPATRRPQILARMDALSSTKSVRVVRGKDDEDALLMLVGTRGPRSVETSQVGSGQ